MPPLQRTDDALFRLGIHARFLANSILGRRDLFVMPHQVAGIGVFTQWGIACPGLVPARLAWILHG
jgi:hypothetical protein